MSRFNILHRQLDDIYNEMKQISVQLEKLSVPSQHLIEVREQINIFINKLQLSHNQLEELFNEINICVKQKDIKKRNNSLKMLNEKRNTLMKRVIIERNILSKFRSMLDKENELIEKTHDELLEKRDALLNKRIAVCKLLHKDSIQTHIDSIVFNTKRYAFNCTIDLDEYNCIHGSNMSRNNTSLLLTDIIDWLKDDTTNVMIDGKHLMDLYHWYKYSLFIIHTRNYKFLEKRQTKIDNEFSELYKNIIKYLLPKHDLEEIVIKLYKPSKVQHIIENYGFDALNEY